ncbi:HAD-like protein [Penicillium freii]|uniref:Uncharacterized protein n=1 Tax=Penicillium freii TaxID=48697 RepID=A0A117NMJ6_PENFR|nr:HAD-like protein [Penicillium freii]KUM59360.1 hypothetical protein ACN42_g7773 [Penicillium freii]
MLSKISSYQAIEKVFHELLTFFLNFLNPALRLFPSPYTSSSIENVTSPPKSTPIRRTAILIEIGNIILDLSFEKVSAIPLYTLKSIICCSATSVYQCGRLTRREYFERLQREFNLSAAEVKETFAQLESAYKVNSALVAFLKELKASCVDLQIYAVANVGKEDHASILNLPFEWDIFDRIFTSTEIGMRKPEPQCFRHVIEAIGKKDEELIFVDWDTDNVMTAISLGMEGIVYKTSTQLQRDLKNLVFEPTGRAREFLRRGAKQFDSISSNGVRIRENFAQLMILEATGDPDLVDIVPHEVTWNYFIGTPVLTQTEFPDDLDTTSLALMVLNRPDHIAHQVLDRMLEYINEDGLVLTFFTDFKNRFDPVVCVNVLGLFFRHGREGQVTKTLEWLRDVVIRRAYTVGTAYYPTPEEFLYFFTRFLGFIQKSHPAVYKEFSELLIPRLKERIRIPVDPVGLAMRLIACEQFGIADEADLKALLAVQCEDGGWEMGVLYQYASKKLKIGNRGVSTALALQAIEGFPTIIGSHTHRFMSGM